MKKLPITYPINHKHIYQMFSELLIPNFLSKTCI